MLGFNNLKEVYGTSELTQIDFIIFGLKTFLYLTVIINLSIRTKCECYFWKGGQQFKKKKTHDYWKTLWNVLGRKFQRISSLFWRLGSIPKIRIRYESPVFQPHSFNPRMSTDKVSKQQKNNLQPKASLIIIRNTSKRFIFSSFSVPKRVTNEFKMKKCY